MYINESPATPRPLWFIFTGLESEIQELDWDLFSSVDPFMSSLHASFNILEERLGIDLEPYLTSNTISQADRAQVAFTALTAIQVSTVTSKMVQTNVTIGIQYASRLLDSIC